MSPTGTKNVEDSALGSVLSDIELPFHVGDAEAAAHSAYAEIYAHYAERPKRA